ncbi:hypothetical protein G7Y89_g4697 [Cudoniella acicularis]|uniref:NADP-dependent oxidoreductase domain-containing protein n=1 Tax=Cudoniella acicularis TaxID=354080 RepID=A0A8H4RNX6_9HELO|nr:hypothetical protein G7Y89_g4697 [Cudoniella acicularis]
MSLESVPPLASRMKLENGQSIPAIFIGLYLTTAEETTQVVQWALEAGYRGVDSAQYYKNEAEAGKAINKFLSSEANISASHLKREDIFFTSKLEENSDYATVKASIKDSVKRSELGYIDLFLLHSPYGGKQARLDSWRAVEDAILDGEVKAGGVSSFGTKHLEELLASNPRIIPAVNQIELHPFGQRTKIVNFCTQHGIKIQCYSPLVHGQRMNHPVLLKISHKYGCSVAQLLVRWGLQHGYVTLPKSVKLERIVENGAVGGFAISAEDMEELDSLEEGLLTDWDPTDCP